MIEAEFLCTETDCEKPKGARVTNNKNVEKMRVIIKQTLKSKNTRDLQISEIN